MHSLVSFQLFKAIGIFRTWPKIAQISMQKMNIRGFSIGLIIGLLIGYWFASKGELEPKIVTVTKTETDTVFVTVRDTIRIKNTEIKHEFVRDTVIIDFKPQIKAFTASKPFLYGNTHLKGEVLGEILKMDIYTDFDIPTVTNTITNTTTIIKKPQGLFPVAGVNKQLTPFVGGVYVRDRYLVGLTTESLFVGYRVFK